jgi:hypothetical protein
MNGKFVDVGNKIDLMKKWNGLKVGHSYTDKKERE